MSPEERAKDLISLLRVDGSWGDWSDVELETLIASAIRQAEASARNEALEEAAAYVEDNSDAYDCWASADKIRNLKTKD